MEPGGVSVTWKNLTVKVDIKTQHLFRKSTRTVKELIHNVNGYVQPKNLVAVMGASGSGKSTLMSVLANRQPGDFKVNGDIRLNGQKIPPALMKTVSGFVYQNDLFTPILTVSEHLHLAARLKLDRKITSKKRAALVDEILMDVGLSQCANRFIGNSNDENVQLNLSGGERKRLSVATELLINPALLFCDEPTTGLDSYTALKLMTTMKNITKQKSKTIICSIHQPSEKIFELFDQIILIYDGKIAFSGAIEEALEFFQSIGYFYDSQQNPADYLVKSLSVVPGQEAKSKDKATEICSKFQISQYAKYAYEQIEYESEKEKLEGLEKIDHIFWLHKLILITYREVLCVIRGPGTQITNILRRVAIAIFLGFCLKKHTVLNQETVQSLTGILFIIENLTCYPPLLLAANHFPRKMPMFMREYSNNMNTPLIFYLSNIVPMIPQFLLDPILFTAIPFALLDLSNSWFGFLISILVSILVFNTSMVCGILVSLTTNNFVIINAITTTIQTFFYPCSGIMMNIRTIPVIFLWIRYVSWLTYAFESLMILYFKDVDHIMCSKSENAPCLKNGQEVLHSLSFDGANLQRNLIIMFSIYLCFHFLSYIALRTRLYFKMNG